MLQIFFLLNTGQCRRLLSIAASLVSVPLATLDRKTDMAKKTTAVPKSKVKKESKVLSVRGKDSKSKKSPFECAVFFKSPAAFGSWLSKNHSTASEVYVGYYKKHTGRQVMTWSQAVDEALCWGWIDSQVKSLDCDRTAQRFTPRKKTSHWSRINVDKVKVLEAAGRMRKAGKAAYAMRTEENTARAQHERETLALSAKCMATLKRNVAAKAYVDGRSPGYRRQVFDWVMSAKQAETQERRLTELIASSAQGLDVRRFRR
jgi:uncharacterized protein YdeI (YjbR/CyaY-like superfamily)